MIEDFSLLLSILDQGVILIFLGKLDSFVPLLCPTTEPLNDECGKNLSTWRIQAIFATQLKWKNVNPLKLTNEGFMQWTSRSISWLWLFMHHYGTNHIWLFMHISWLGMSLFSSPPEGSPLSNLDLDPVLNFGTFPRFIRLNFISLANDQDVVQLSFESRMMT